MATTQDFRNGLAFKMDGDIYFIVEFQHVKPGKGGAFVRTKIKKLLTGAVIERTFRSGDKVEDIRVEKRAMQYIYREDEHFIFMDTESFEQIPVPQDVVGDAADFMKVNEVIDVSFGEEKPLVVDLPFHVELKITHCEPGVRGDTATGATKPATLESGATVQVPLFVNEGDTIRVDTRSKEYVSRA